MIRLQPRPVTAEWQERARVGLELSDEWDQRSLAKSIGCSESTLSQLLGKTPPKTSRFIDAISQRLNLVAPEFADGDEEELVIEMRRLKAANPAGHENIRRQIRKLTRELKSDTTTKRAT